MDESLDSSEPKDTTTPSFTLPRVFDLNSNEECLIKTNPLESLHMVQPSAWYIGPGTTDGTVLPENLLNSPLHPADDLSGTTVTLSYLTRSHVFDPQIYTIPLSKTFSLYPASPGAPPCLDAVPPCLDPAPPCLAACASHFHLVSSAPVEEDMAGLCFLQQPQDMSIIENGATLWNGNLPAFSEENGHPELVFLISQPGESTGLAVPLNPDLINALDPLRMPKATALKDSQASTAVPVDSPEEIKNTTQDGLSVEDTTSLKTTKQNGDTASEQNEAKKFNVTRRPEVTQTRKELPPRSTRGMRLGAIFQNIYPTRFKSCNTFSQKKSPANQIASKDASAKHSTVEKYCLKNKAGLHVNEGLKSRQISTSNSGTVFKHSSRKKTRQQKSLNKFKKVEKNKTSMPLSKCSSTESRENMKNKAALLLPKCSPKSTLSSSRETSQVKVVEKLNKAKIKKKQQLKARKMSMFVPQEPEIRLRILENKDRRREKRDETFMPFVHIDLRGKQTCVIVNYPEEGTRLTRGKQVPQTSGKIPVSSSVQFGRVSTEGVRQAWLVCCLCGGAANTTDLGDLHGPYYSEGFGPKGRRTEPAQESRDDDSTDSDFVDADCSRRTCSRLQGAQRNLDLSSTPTAKRPQMDGGVDWYTPPMVPVHEREFWFHEDCGVWSAGVYLVRGKLYGLENAVKEAQQTVCSCCHKSGASLGCFFKNCPNKYHYLCAIQSGCVLNGENFSMKCRKHKNKSIKAVSSYKASDR